MTAMKGFKALVKKFVVMPVVARLRGWLHELDERSMWPSEIEEVEFDNTYPWLQSTFLEVLSDPICAQKPMYIWGLAEGAALARVLGIPRISTIEFGVAMGAGLKSLERIAEHLETKTGVNIDVYGFDTGSGLPKPEDYRDQPNMWLEGQLPMNQDLLKTELRRASLRIGPVKDTIRPFLNEHVAPVAFVSFDLDLYTSTRDALHLFTAKYDSLLPRIVCYFDDIMGHTYSEYTGERLARAEFNRTHEMRKLSPIYDLWNFAPRPFRGEMFWDCLYFAHFFDHPLYNIPDSIRKTVYADGKVAIRCPVDSEWRNAKLFEFAQTIGKGGGTLYLTAKEIEERMRSRGAVRSGRVPPT
jgi:hypothetical protein